MQKVQSLIIPIVLMATLTIINPLSVSAQGPFFEQLKKKIVLDPGHGGRDSGGRGANNLLEKDLTLMICQTMAGQLTKDFSVTLTRNGDYDTDLNGRTETANQFDGDLLISIHTGANFIHERRGMAIYYFERPNMTMSEKSKNQSAAKPPVEIGTWGQTQTKYVKISKNVALSLKNHIAKTLNIKDVQVKGLPARLLSAADMPAILVEIGHITNPSDENHLSDPKYRDDIARELCQGIKRCFYSGSSSLTN